MSLEKDIEELGLFGAMTKESEKEFLDRKFKQQQELKYHPEMLSHRINYLFKEYTRMAENEKRLWKDCDDFDERLKKLENSNMDILQDFERRIITLENDLERLDKNLSSIWKGQARRLARLETCTGKLIREKENPVEEQKTNLTFDKALIMLKNGKKLSRWEHNVYVCLNNENEFVLRKKYCFDNLWFATQIDLLDDNWRMIE